MMQGMWDEERQARIEIDNAVSERAADEELVRRGPIQDNLATLCGILSDCETRRRR